MKHLLRFACVIAGLFAVALAFADVGVPPLARRVTDLTATLDAAQREALETRLAAIEQRKGAQVAVLIVPSTQPETIEQYAVRVFEQWKLGRKDVDDGVLLLVAKDDRRVRIEVGYGLEGAIPDAAASRIIAEYLTPHFRAGDFAGGIDAAVEVIGRLIDGEALPAPLDDAQPAPPWLIYLFVAIFAVVPAGVLNRALNGLPLSVLSRRARRLIGFLVGLLAVYAFAGVALDDPLLHGIASEARWSLVKAALVSGAVGALLAPFGASDFGLARGRRWRGGHAQTSGWDIAIGRASCRERVSNCV